MTNETKPTIYTLSASMRVRNRAGDELLLPSGVVFMVLEEPTYAGGAALRLVKAGHLSGSRVDVTERNWKDGAYSSAPMLSSDDAPATARRRRTDVEILCDWVESALAEAKSSKAHDETISTIEAAIVVLREWASLNVMGRPVSMTVDALEGHIASERRAPGLRAMKEEATND